MERIELSAGTIEYDDTGSGPVVVLVHGVHMTVHCGGTWSAISASTTAASYRHCHSARTGTRWPLGRSLADRHCTAARRVPRAAR